MVSPLFKNVFLFLPWKLVACILLLTSLARSDAFLAASKNGVSQVYLKLPLFFSNDDLYSLCTWEKTGKSQGKWCLCQQCENIEYIVLQYCILTRDHCNFILPRCRESCCVLLVPSRVCPTHSSQYPWSIPDPLCTWAVINKITVWTILETNITTKQ